LEIPSLPKPPGEHEGSMTRRIKTKKIHDKGFQWDFIDPPTDMDR
jgi:hypothetical protein